MIANGFFRRVAKSSLLMLAVVLLSAGYASVATACPTCSQALADEQHGQGDIVAGYFWSIIFMMSMPFLLVTSFCGYMYLEVRKARAAQALAMPDSESLSSGQCSCDCDDDETAPFNEQAAEPAEVAG